MYDIECSDFFIIFPSKSFPLKCIHIGARSYTPLYPTLLESKFLTIPLYNNSMPPSLATLTSLAEDPDTSLGEECTRAELEYDVDNSMEGMVHHMTQILRGTEVVAETA